MSKFCQFQKRLLFILHIFSSSNKKVETLISRFKYAVTIFFNKNERTLPVTSWSCIDSTLNYWQDMTEPENWLLACHKISTPADAHYSATLDQITLLLQSSSRTSGRQSRRRAVLYRGVSWWCRRMCGEWKDATWNMHGWIYSLFVLCFNPSVAGKSSSTRHFHWYYAFFILSSSPWPHRPLSHRFHANWNH